MQGFNCTFEVHQISQDDDDAIGGAVSTGTFVGFVRGRIEPRPPMYAFLAQGIESIETFDLHVSKNDVAIRSNDQVALVLPRSHDLLNVRLNVVQVRSTSMHPKDRRRFRHLVTQRAVRARGQV